MKLKTILSCRLGGLAAGGLALALAGSIAAAEPARVSADLGDVDFRVSCGAEVRGDFDRALAMLHHMMYEQARGQFQALAEREPDCAMAHWGVTTTRFQPLWGTRPDTEVLQSGWREIQRAKEAGTESERERALIAATEAFFREPESAAYAERQRRWAEAMKQARKTAPDDEDVAAFYALSLLARGQVADDPRPLHAKAESILRDVHQEKPRHPGAIHYIIHTDDIAGRAERNLEIVESYGEVAPEIPHALHMPSHIYVRLGDWPRVIEWNERSAAAALEHPADGQVSLHYPHAQDYRVYAHLQRGEDERAREVMEETFRQGLFQPTPVSAFHVATLPARIAVERRDWETAASLEVNDHGYLPWDSLVGRWAESHTRLARGLGAVHTGDADGAQAELDRIRALRGDVEDRGEPAFADRIRIHEEILAGWIAQGEGRAGEAVDRLRQAAALEEALEKHPVTPGALVPPKEALGELLLELDRPGEALACFRSSAEVWPRRYHTLLGAARAAAAAGDEAASREYYRALLDSVAADSERAGIAEARETMRES
jgi:hypothetical protein